MRMLHARTRALALVALLLLLGATACGNGDGTAAPEASPGDDETLAQEGPVSDEEGPPEGNPCAPDAPELPEEEMPPPPEEGATAIDVVAVDYAFQGVDASYAAGTYAFNFRNEGLELHEMALFRIDDDESRSAEELLQLEEGEAEDAVSEVTGTFACPGEEGPSTGAELDAGRYAMVCFVPVGLTAEVTDFESLDGPPHFTQGMHLEFAVE